jgi:signal peptide peptidase SppA
MDTLIGNDIGVTSMTTTGDGSGITIPGLLTNGYITQMSYPLVSAPLQSGPGMSPLLDDRLMRTLGRLLGRKHMVDIRALFSGGYDEPKPYETRDGIAIIEVSGPIMSESYWYATYDSILEAAEMAAQDAAVKGILLRMNSPGGECNRAFEAAAELEAIGQRKPLWSIADTSAYSAGYMLACCADKIFVSPTTGGVGSVGVYTSHMDFSEFLKKSGINVTLIGEPDGKTSGNPYEPLDEEDEEEIRAEVSRLAAEFYSFVARRRRMTADEVKGLNAKCFEGSGNAIGSKLADASGTLKSVVAEMAAMVNTKIAALAATTPKKENRMDQQETAAGAVATPSEQAPAPAPQQPAAAVPAVVEMPKPGAVSLETTLALCAVAGLSAIDAQVLNAKGMTLPELQAHLLGLRAAADLKTPTISLTSGAAPGGSYAALEARASSQGDVTKEQFIANSLRTNPNIYAQYLEENPAQISRR